MPNADLKTTDLVARLRELAGPRYPDDICGKALMGQAADEIVRLRRGWLRVIQQENGCAPYTGAPCREPCGCVEEMEMLANEQR